MARQNPLNPHEPTLIFERSVEGRYGTQVLSDLRFRSADETKQRLPDSLKADVALELPMVDELSLARHYLDLSQRTFGIDTGFYPLGSCTMKYNPKELERLMRIPGFNSVHPAQESQTLPGNLEILFELQEWLAEVSGFDAVSLQPAAGAQGEFAGLLIFRRYFDDQGEQSRRVMLVPDSAHGTNPASAVLAGFEVHEIKCAPYGGIMTPELLEEALAQYGADHIAGIMLTNPSTLGTFEENILPIGRRLKDIGAQLYYDGANLNALVGIARPGDMGFDLMHYNTHKTFSTPHGGGGPGSGPIGVKAHLAPYLPHPRVQKTADGGYEFFRPDKSIGRMKMYHGQWGMIVRCWAYILLHGPAGLRRNTESAILNANYLQARLKEAYPIPYSARPDGSTRYCMHEFVASAGQLKRDHHVTGKDIAKALLNSGFHAPTMYFPLIVEEALMIEPTESEGKATLDSFAETMIHLAYTAARDSEALRKLDNLEVTNLDETYAARNINVRWQPEKSATKTEGAG